EAGGELPDIVFLDLNMPQKTGFECVQEIKKQARLQQVGIVVLSTSADARIVKQLYQCGADRYLFKPNNFADLKALISRVFHLRFQTGLRCTSDNDFVLQP
ncbi:MAG: response regulator, partial [Chitinophagaceae bacterium]